MPVSISTLKFLAIAFVLLIPLVIILLMINSARRQRARREFLLQHGFVSLDAPDADLIESVRRLYLPHLTRKLRLSNIFLRPIGTGRLYIFDLDFESSDETSEAGRGVFSIRSPDLRLPYLHLMPYPRTSGQEGHLKETGFGRMLDWVLNKTGLQLLDFPDPPAFARRYMVLGRLEEEAALRSYLDSERMARLASGERCYEIMGAGDFFTLKPMDKNQANQTTDASDETQLEWQVADAQQLLAWLK